MKKNCSTIYHRICITAIALTTCFLSQAQTDSLFPGFNSTLYPNVLLAAKGVARPFLLMQKYTTLSGANVTDSIISYKGSHYLVHDYYLNPTTAYYVQSSQYTAYNISGFSSVWPTQFPNILFKSSDTSYNCQSDCVGYLTRLLSATGNTTTNGNAYLNIINTVKTANVSHFAAIGYVSTAYSFAVAFPTFPASVSNGWQYIAGNAETSLVNTYNHTIQSSLGTYTGVRKGGFAQALPGDVLAFGYSASSSSNGHIMVMETAPQLLNADSMQFYFPPQSISQAKALLNTNHMYSVPVFDCSGQQAHFRDSRTLTSGIGHGKLLILTAISDDAPTGFIFDSLQATYSTPHLDTLGTSVYAISVGRFVTTSTTAVRSLDNPNTVFQIYPNPAKGIINIAMGKPQPENSILKITDMLGNTVKQISIYDPEFILNLTDLKEGIYTISISNKDGVSNKRLVIIK